MEITLKNAFYVIIKISIRPCEAAYKFATEIIQEKTYNIAYNLLQNPILTVVIAVMAMILVMIAVTVSFIIIATITFLVALLTVVESTFKVNGTNDTFYHYKGIFILICVLILVNIGTIIMFTLIITTYLIKFKSLN